MPGKKQQKQEVATTKSQYLWRQLRRLVGADDPSRREQIAMTAAFIASIFVLSKIETIQEILGRHLTTWM